MDPYLVDHEKTKQIDQQVLKLQESPDMVPIGELPRHALLTVDRYLTNKVFPGAKITVLGIYDVFQSSTSSVNLQIFQLKRRKMEKLLLEILIWELLA